MATAAAAGTKEFVFEWEGRDRNGKQNADTRTFRFTDRERRRKGRNDAEADNRTDRNETGFNQPDAAQNTAACSKNAAEEKHDTEEKFGLYFYRRLLMFYSS